jgi:hypothetical protein
MTVLWCYLKIVYVIWNNLYISVYVLQYSPADV